MKAVMAIIILLLSNPLSFSQIGSISNEIDQSGAEDPFIDLEGRGHYFIENMGQYPEEIDFVSETDFGHVGVGPSGLYYHIITGSEGDKIIENVVTVQFQNSNSLDPRGSDKMDMKCNFFLGDDHNSWVSGISVYRTVEIFEIYPGIDARLYFKEGRFKYDLIVGPEAEPSGIKMKYRGQSGINVGPRDIDLELPGGAVLKDGGLFTYSRDSGKTIPSGYIRNDPNTISFLLKERPIGETLVIDPLVYSTYIGGGDSDSLGEMESSENGTVYLGGITESANFPTTPGSYERNLSVNGTSSYHDIFLIRMDPTGRYPLYSTFIGGDSVDHIYSMDIAHDGSVVFSGYTYSSDFPLTNGSFNDTTASSVYNSFIARISFDGSSLIFSTFLWHTCIADDVKVHGERGIIFSGYANSSYVKPKNQTIFNGSNKGVIIGVLTLDGTDVVHSSMIGGSSSDRVRSSVLSGDRLTVFGYTFAANFPNDTFLKMAPPGIMYTYMFSYDLSDGSFHDITLMTGVDHRSFILQGPDDETYILGNGGDDRIEGTDNAIDKTYNGNVDLNILSLNDSGTGLDYFTYFGGPGSESITSAYFDGSGMLVVGGLQRSGQYPVTSDSWSGKRIGGSDIFISILDIENKTVIHSTLLGSANNDNLKAMTEGPDGKIIAGGNTWSDQRWFPTTDDAFQGGSEVDGVSMFFLHYTLPRVASAPRNLSYEMEQSNGWITGINLSWDEPQDWGNCRPVGYMVYRWQEGDRPVVLNEDEVRNVTYYHDDDLEYDGEEVFGYYYRVHAITEYETHSAPSTIRIEDRKGPNIQLFEIPEYEEPGSVFDLDVICADPSGIDEVWFQYSYNGGENRKFVYYNETICHGELILEKVLGRINFTVFARDRPGNLNRTDVVSIPIRDVRSPRLIKDHTPLSVKSGEMLPIRIELMDNHRIEEAVVQIEDEEGLEHFSLENDGDFNWTYNYETVVEPGEIRYRFNITDPSGNHRNTTWRRVGLFVEKPVIIEDMTPGKVDFGDHITFRVRIGNSIYLDEVTIYLEMEYRQMTYEGEDNWSYVYEWNEQFSMIEYRFRYTTKWNQTYGSRNFGTVNYVDDIYPEVVEYTDLTSRNITTYSMHNLSVRVEDNFRVKSVSLIYWVNDERELGEYLLSAGYDLFYRNFRIPKEASTFGYHFRITDYGGNSINTTRIDLSVHDNIPPGASFLSNHSLSTNDGRKNIYFDIYDNIEVSDFRIEFWDHDFTEMEVGQVLYDPNRGRYYFTINCGPTEATFHYRVNVVDTQGNNFESNIYEIDIRDNEPPVIEGIEDRIFRAGEEFRIVLEIRDNMGVTSVRWEGVPIASHDNVLEGRIDRRGIYEVEVTAQDRRGNWASESFVIVIESPQEDNDLDNLWLIYLLVSIVLLLIVIIMILMAVILSKGKNDPPERENEEGSERALDNLLESDGSGRSPFDFEDHDPQ